MKKKKTKKKNKFKKYLKKFFNSVKFLIIILILIIVVLLLFCNHLMNANKTYMFSGASDYVTILNGVISLNYDVNLLSGSDINYVMEEDKIVSEYKIGYYIFKDNTLSPFVIKTGTDDEGLSLKGLINEMSAFNITEPYNIKRFFTKENKEALEEGLYFIIEAKTIDNEEILDKTEISLSKVSN
ncbi:MAG: hypothetical protein PHX04_03605 [Bacilli bacterium]|nr:hypothetical protein [Bacilli bacterium]